MVSIVLIFLICRYEESFRDRCCVFYNVNKYQMVYERFQINLLVSVVLISWVVEIEKDFNLLQVLIDDLVVGIMKMRILEVKYVQCYRWKGLL